MAENTGGTCMISPVNCASTASMASRSGRASLVTVTSPSASSVSVSAPQRTVKR